MHGVRGVHYRQGVEREDRQWVEKLCVAETIKQVLQRKPYHRQTHVLHCTLICPEFPTPTNTPPTGLSRIARTPPPYTPPDLGSCWCTRGVRSSRGQKWLTRETSAPRSPRWRPWPTRPWSCRTWSPPNPQKMKNPLCMNGEEIESNKRYTALKKTNSHTGIYFLLTTEQNQAPEGDLINSSPI